MGGSSGGTQRRAGDGESEIIVQRADLPINAGFKEWVYIDGVQKLVLTKGDQGRIVVPNGKHTIHAELYSMTTEKMEFTANSNTLTFLISPYSVHDFAIEQVDSDSVQITQAESDTPEAVSPQSVSSRPASSQLSAINDNSIEGSLARAAVKIMEKVSPTSRMAIVYVTAKDPDIAEFIANELEFIMVDQGLTLIDRSQLDRIRKEQNFQLSGEVDDDQAVSIGKIAGADVILTGAVTGTGNIRRLRLRALSTQSAQVLAATSERY
jgi:pyrimidine operon attenuation protein/uracil phosphoribosyltransferase